MLRLWRMIRDTGRIAEPSPPRPARAAAPRTGADGNAGATVTALHGSVQIRHVDSGSCNGCEVEIGAAFGPVYDRGPVIFRREFSLTLPVLVSAVLVL